MTPDRLSRKFCVAFSPPRPFLVLCPTHNGAHPMDRRPANVLVRRVERFTPCSFVHKRKFVVSFKFREVGEKLLLSSRSLPARSLTGRRTPIPTTIDFLRFALPSFTRRLRSQMRRLLVAKLLVLFAFLFAVAEATRGEDPKLLELLRRSPSLSNAMGFVDVASLDRLTSGRALPDRIVENVDQLWFIADLDLHELHPTWEAGMVGLKQPVEAAAMAADVGGYVDEVMGQEVVWSPESAYFVPLDGERLGMLRPDNRSLLAEWISPSGGPVVPFLEQLANQPEDFLSFMLALHLEHAAIAGHPRQEAREL